MALVAGIFPEIVYRFYNLSKESGGLVQVPWASKLWLVNDPVLVKLVLNSNKTVLTRETGVIKWRSVVAEHSEISVRLLGWLRGNEFEARELEELREIWIKMWDAGRVVTESCIAGAVLSFLLNDKRITYDSLIAFHEAACYFEDNRANNYSSTRSHIWALHQHARARVVAKVLNREANDLSEVEQVASLIHAGYRSLINALGWMIYASAMYKEQLIHMRQSSNNSKDQYNFVLEVLRMFPSAWMLHRTVKADIKLGQHYLCHGHQLQISPICFHYNSKYFEQSGLFNPTRFKTHPIQPYTYFPFGGGAFSCPGKSPSLKVLKSFLECIPETITVESSGMHPQEEVPISLSPFKSNRFQH